VCHFNVLLIGLANSCLFSCFLLSAPNYSSVSEKYLVVQDNFNILGSDSYVNEYQRRQQSKTKSP